MRPGHGCRQLGSPWAPGERRIPSRPEPEQRRWMGASRPPTLGPEPWFPSGADGVGRGRRAIMATAARPHPHPPLPGAAAPSQAGWGGAGVARTPPAGVSLRGLGSRLPPFTYFNPAERAVGEGRRGGRGATWWPRVSGPFSFEACPSGRQDVLFPFALQVVLCPGRKSE